MIDPTLRFPVLTPEQFESQCELEAIAQEIDTELAGTKRDERLTPTKTVKAVMERLPWRTKSHSSIA
ncbi:MAG: hypothetical protein KGL39_09720 [Patescibacteria group bacterium]|nr:hypothetical protein [Patescibacteria group bacterium]